MNRFEKLLGEYKLVFGLEIHLHLRTSTKMFCGCSANIYGAEPNIHTCPVCLGLPGALPVPNYEAVRKTHILGLALNCTLNKESQFDRKHYFYPDLPKGYQISQYRVPLCEKGYLILNSGDKIEIERVHLEEDTGKSFHKGSKTLVDFNKCGMPLVEIVTDPSFRNIDDAVEFSKKVHDIVKWLDLSDVNMEEGQMRLEANISLRTAEMERNDKLPDYKVEIKNINSFRFMEKAVKAEVIRQRSIFESGGKVIQENRGYNEKKDITVSQRGKEEARDYRYFPEPDIPPMVFSDDYLDELKAVVIELPDEITERLMSQYSLNRKNAIFFSRYPGLALLEKFEILATENIDPNIIANLLVNRPGFRDLSIERFKKALEERVNKLEDTEQLMNIVSNVIKENSTAVNDFRKGKIASLDFLLGQVMKETKGKASPHIVKCLLVEELSDGS